MPGNRGKNTLLVCALMGRDAVGARRIEDGSARTCPVMASVVCPLVLSRRSSKSWQERWGGEALGSFGHRQDVPLGVHA